MATAPDAAAASDMIARLERLFTAASEGDAKAFKKLVRSDFHDQDLQALADGRKRTLLHHAASCGRENICIHLVEDLEFDVNRKDAHGETPLSFAAASGHAKTVERLLQYDAKVQVAAICERAAPAPRGCPGPALPRPALAQQPAAASPR
jgi:hypothetical protein